MSSQATIVAIPGLIISLLCIVCLWKIFVKIGKPGWFSIIPIFNFIALYQVAGALKFLLIQIGGTILFSIICNIKGDIFVIGSFICLFAIIISSFAFSFMLAKKFNKDILFGIVLTLFPIIGYSILALGKSQYNGSNITEKEEENNTILDLDDEDKTELEPNENEEDLSEFTNENYIPEEDEEDTEIEDLDDKEFIDPPITIQDEEPIDNEEDVAPIDNSIEEENDAVDTIEQEEVDEDDEQQDEDSDLETKEIEF